MIHTQSHKYLDTKTSSTKYRSLAIGISKKEILITNFKDTEQSKDLTLPYNCEGFGRVHHFKRNSTNGFPPNSLPIDPAQYALNLPFSDIIKVQVFQNAACSWRCWYCFVDYKLLAANQKYSQYLSASELLDLYQKEENQYPIIDLSGGQPDLVPEWSLWMADEISKRGLKDKIYLWTDDNLSNDYLWKYLSKEEIKRLANYGNYGRVGCFKGFDEESFSFNTSADPSYYTTQFATMKRLIESGIDVYGYITLTSPNDTNIEKKIINFLDRVQQQLHPLFPLRIIPLQIFEFTPTKSRTNIIHRNSIEIQTIAVSIWNNEIQKRFSKDIITKRIFEHNIF